ncbi:MAG: aldose 1-epimerase family protein [Anaerolineae bacterium]
MPTLFGKHYTAHELRERVGDMAQLAGITPVTVNGDSADGVRGLEFYTGNGFRFTVLPDRGMDIAGAEWRGAPLAWMGSAGVRHPAFHEPQGIGFLRGFFGGLLTTCGLSNVGVPNDDQGEHYGLHGRINHLPAHQVSYSADWQGDEYVLTARGKMRETRLFGENLLLSRTITTKLGSDSVLIEDTIENQGFEPAPVMILYHINAGFPVLDEGSELLIRSQITPRDEEAHQGLDRALRGDRPLPGFKEQVHIHTVETESDGWAAAALVNPQFDGGAGIGLCVRYRPDQLPYFMEWRMVGQGAYVMGLEPANCSVMGRAGERREGRLEVLAPGQRKAVQVEIRAVTSRGEIDRLRG